MLVYSCPKTGLDVRTALGATLDVLRRMGILRLSLWCPHCLVSHQVIAKDAIVDVASPALVPASVGHGAQTPK
jgi:hypothetical protein